MSFILELNIPGSERIRFMRVCTNPFDCVERFLCYDIVNYDFRMGFSTCGFLIYRMDHADWRPSYNGIKYDDIVVDITCLHHNEFSIGISYRGRGAFMLGSACMVESGVWDYSELVGNLGEMECAN